MAILVDTHKACTINPLKMSAPLGAAYAYLGLESCMPLMHGSQGCTSFGLVVLVRHFKEAIPLQTTAMNEVTTILGGLDNLEKALVNIHQKSHPRFIGICSTGLTETRGDDVRGHLKLIRNRHPELAATAIVYVSTPDYIGGFQEGYARAVTAIVHDLVHPGRHHRPRQVNLLPGCHLTPADIDELKEIVAAFGLVPLVLPDLSRSLDGHIPEDWRGTTLGGTTPDEIDELGDSALTLAFGEQMRSAAMELEMAAGVPFVVFDRASGLDACDRLMTVLAQVSGVPVPAKFRRQRSQLLDAMLDSHFHIGNVKVALGAEPDLLWATGMLLHEMGARLEDCVTTSAAARLEQLPAAQVIVGDLDDLEQHSAGCDVMLTHSQGRQMAERTGLPFMRIGMPLFDRVGAAHIVSVGYRGTMRTLFEFANLMQDHQPHAQPHDWPLPEAVVTALGTPAGAYPAGTPAAAGEEAGASSNRAQH